MRVPGIRNGSSGRRGAGMRIHDRAGKCFMHLNWLHRNVKVQVFWPAYPTLPKLPRDLDVFALPPRRSLLPSCM